MSVWEGIVVTPLEPAYEKPVRKDGTDVDEDLDDDDVDEIQGEDNGSPGEDDGDVMQHENPVGVDDVVKTSSESQETTE